VPGARVFIDIDGLECELVACDLASGEWSVAVAGFGSSDCRRCRAHLLVFRG
jgi:Uri superfamily endonuclease